MIYGQDSPIAFPVADLYDTGVMQMYLNAVRDQYQQGLKDYENFISKYGDFTSPFAKDVDRWNNEVMGPTMNLIDALYAQGIDPMRNAEARAMIQRSVRSVPYAEAAKMKQNAAAGEAYLKARGALAAKGLYDKDYNDFWLAEQGYKPFEEWSSEDGIWNVTSPIEYKSLFDATSPWFEKMQKHDLTKEQVLAAKYPYDPKYRYTGIPVEDLQEVTGRSLPGFMNSFEGRYYRKRVADRLAAAGIEPTDDAVNAALANDIVTANHRVVVDPIAEVDQYALEEVKNRYEIQKQNRQFAHEINKLKLAAQLKDDGEGGSSSRSSSGGSGSGKESFSDAQYQLMRGTTYILGKTGYGQAINITDYSQFDPERMNNLLAPAQSDIASKYYSGETLNSYSVQNIKPSSKNGKISLGFNPDSFISTRGKSKTFGTKSYNQALNRANKGFLDDISLDYSPAKFAKWSNRSTMTGDDTMINISNDTDAINRIYSVDEVALSSAGVDRPEDLGWAGDKTDSIRKSLNKGSDQLYMKSTGKYVSRLANDGSVHTYQFIKVYNVSGTMSKKVVSENKVGIVMYDMGITTYNNPNFGINSNTDTNLYFDDNIDADTRWSGDMNVLNWEHIGSPNIESTIAYPQIP